jgi:hypothetical protein
VFRTRREIWYSLLVIAVVTALYLFVYQQAGELPPAFGLVGHGIGVLGFVLMLMTETLYSIRKRMPGAAWGSTASWMRFHVFTGLVGPYMVLLHTSMKFRGLAGVSLLLSAVVVASGIFGRYVFTSVPHAELGAGGEIVDRPRVIATPVAAIAFESASPAAAIDTPGTGTSRRRTLAVWRSLHVPLTWVLFATAFVHAIMAFYYATLQR